MTNLRAVLFLVLFSLSSNAKPENYCSASQAKKQSLADQIIQCESELSGDFTHDIETIRRWIYLAGLYRKAGDTNKSTEQLAQISSKAKALGAEASYEVLFAQGVNSYYSRQFIDSLNYFKLAHQYAKETNDIKALANVYNALANVAQVFADYQSMSHLLEESLSIYRKIEDSAGVVKVLNNLGNAYRFNGDDNKALVVYRQALAHHLEQENRLNVAHTRMNMARSLIKLEQQDKAIELLKISIKELTEIGAIHRIIESNGLIARAYLSLGDLKATDKYLQDNQELKLQIDSGHFDPGSELVRANFYQATGQLNFAKQILMDGVAKSRQQQNIEQLKKYLNTLASLLAEMGQAEMSGQYWQEYSDVLAEQLEQKKRYFGKLNFITRLELTKTLQGRQASDREFALTYQVLGWLGVMVFFCSISFFLYQKRKAKFGLNNEQAKVTGDVVHGVETIAEVKPVTEAYLVIERQQHDEQNKIQKNEIQRNEIQKTVINTRQRLVELMLLATQLWEQETQLDRIELAEQSKIWKVTVDDGRLRVRAMERYLNIEKLPSKPRWRNVVRTCHYVLGKCDNASILREELAAKLAEYLNLVKQQASS